MTASGAMTQRMPADERRAMLLAVPDLGRITRRHGRIVIDWSPHIRDAGRYLWAFAGSPFLDEAHAEQVRQTICRDARHMPLEDAIARFRGRRSRAHKAVDVIDRYLAAAPGLVSERTDRRLAPRTLAAYAAVLRRARPWFGDQTIHEATQADALRRFKAWFSAPPPAGRGLESDQEARNAFAALRAVVAWYRTTRRDFPAPDWPSMPTALTAKRRGLARRGPPARIGLPDVVRAIEAMPEARRPIFWAMLYCGARPTEARGVLGRDWDRPRLSIRRSAASRRSDAPVRDVTKTGEVGTYELPAWLADLIDRHRASIAPDAPLFTQADRRSRGALYSDDSLRACWMAACARVGLPPVPVYRAMKHTQVGALRAAGLPVEDIVAQYRWTGSAMLEHYDEARDERRGGVVARLDELVGRTRKK